MKPRSYEMASEFCEIVNSSSLLHYLSCEEADTDEARAKLKARRKYMQGMQGNPKYRKEALFLIKHFNALNEVLGDLPRYKIDVAQRAESIHLPVLEMTIKGVLTGGPLSDTQDEYLLEQAIALGVSPKTYHSLVQRLTVNAGYSSKQVSSELAPLPEEPSKSDLYIVLGIEPTASNVEVQLAYEHRLEEASTLPAPEAEELRADLQTAKSVLLNHASRNTYDRTMARTGAPARARAQRPDQTATAPPVRQRSVGPTANTMRPGVIEITGPPVRQLYVQGSQPTETILELQNTGDQPIGGRINEDGPWTQVFPNTLNPNQKHHQIRVRIDPTKLPDQTKSVVITLTTDRGEVAQVVYEIERAPSLSLIAALMLVILGLLVLAVALVIELM